MSNSFIWPMGRTLSGATTPVRSGPGSDDNEGVLYIPLSYSITGASPSDCLVSYLGHSLGGVFPLCRDAVGVFYSPSKLGCVQRRGTEVWFFTKGYIILIYVCKCVCVFTQPHHMSRMWCQVNFLSWV